MEKANKFFFLENVKDNVNCDFNRQGSTMAWTFEECMKIVTTLSGDDRYMGVLFEIELA